MVYVWIIAGLMVASGLLQLVSVISLRRRIERVEDQAARPGPAEVQRATVELERALGRDLDGLPPFWRTLVRLHREMTRP